MCSSPKAHTLIHEPNRVEAFAYAHGGRKDLPEEEDHGDGDDNLCVFGSLCCGGGRWGQGQVSR